MIRTASKLVLITSFALIMVVIAIWSSEIKRQFFMWGVVDRVQFEIRAARLGPYLDEIILLAKLPAGASFHHQVDGVRHFIDRHSTQVADAEIYGPDGGYILMAKKLIGHAKGQTPILAGLDCSWRAELMADILNRIGYETRTVSAFDTDLAKGVPQQSHTFLEVKNPQTGTWESEDPYLNLYWKSRTTDMRASVVEFSEKLEDIIPCNSRACGWDIIEPGVPKNLIADFDVFAIFNRLRNKRYAVYTSRANLSAVHANAGRRGKFCDVYFYSCRSGFFSSSELKMSKAPL